MRRARVFVPWSAKSPESYTNTVYVKSMTCAQLCFKYSNANVLFRGRRFLSKFSSIYLFFYLSISERSSAGKHNEHHSAVAWRSFNVVPHRTRRFGLSGLPWLNAGSLFCAGRLYFSKVESAIIPHRHHAGGKDLSAPETRCKRSGTPPVSVLIDWARGHQRHTDSFT